MNKVIKILILSDVALLTGLGFITPIFAIFLSENIKGGGAKVAGFAAAIYWIVESLVVIPFGKYLDKNHGEKDDLIFVIVGCILAGISVLFYIFSYLPWHIYLLQVIYAIGMGMNIPGYTAIFTRHIDRGKEAFEWSVRSSLVGFSTGIAGALGGIIASNFGFNVLFIGVAIFVLISAFIPVSIYKNMMPTKKLVKAPLLRKFRNSKI